jgi:GMP synthase (glutamine-hydrolysing)
VRTDGILILEFGSPHTRTLARRIRELGVYCEIHPHDVLPAAAPTLDLRGVVLSGGPARPGGDKPLFPRREVMLAGVPVLAVGGGMQAMAVMLRGQVARGGSAAYSRTRLSILRQSPLFETLADAGAFEVWMSRGLAVTEPPPGFEVTAKAEDGRVAAMEHLKRRYFAVQFHPEVPESEHGLQVLDNFCHAICEQPGTWDLDDYLKKAQIVVRDRAGDGPVLVLLDGGESARVALALARVAVGGNAVGLEGLAAPQVAGRARELGARLVVDGLDAAGGGGAPALPPGMERFSPLRFLFPEEVRELAGTLDPGARH